MTQPPTGADEPGWARAGAPVDEASEQCRAGTDAQTPPAVDPSATTTRGFRGGRVVTIATLVVIGVAAVEAALRDEISTWTGVTLVAVAIICPLVTRKGDRSLPAMMPPLAFLTAVLISGQLLVANDGGGFDRVAEVTMIVSTLGANAVWVVAATVLSTTIAAVRHFTDR